MTPKDRVRALWRVWGTVSHVTANEVLVAGLSAHAGVGHEIGIDTSEGTVAGEVVSVSTDESTALLFSQSDAVRIGDKAWLRPNAVVFPSDNWLGHVVDHRGETAPHARSEPDLRSKGRRLRAPPPESRTRRGLGARLNTGWMIMDTVLPICRGQRMGLFAGSGVGKSTFLGLLAAHLDADRIVIALVGERSREINEFVSRKLPREVLDRCVVVAASADESPSAKKRAAYCAMAAAEHFRDQGRHVLLIFDSITRFAEAHRETALAMGEAPALNAFPASTTRVVSELAERAGPGGPGGGDITAVYSVLVAGSDLEEPVADMMRGILDGHVVLSRDIAERGRYPAIDALKSVSRALPDAASHDETEMIRLFRRHLSLHQRVEPMVRAGLFEPGHDPEADLAIALFPELDAFVAARNDADVAAAFRRLADLLAAEPNARSGQIANQAG